MKPYLQINLTAGNILMNIPLRESTDQNRQTYQVELDVPYIQSLDVPYIQSQHYDSGAEFMESLGEQGGQWKGSTSLRNQKKGQHALEKQIYGDLEDQNFTDQEQDQRKTLSMHSINSCEGKPIHSKYISHTNTFEQGSDQQQYVYSSNSFKFVRHPKQCSSSKVGLLCYPFSQAKFQEECCQLKQQLRVKLIQDQVQNLYNLKETAYFMLERERIDRVLVFDERMGKVNNQNFSSLNQGVKGNIDGKHCGKKGLILDKILKEKSRKQIAQLLKKQRHFVKKFIK